MLRFVLCADDFALSEGVSGAVLDLLRRRRLTATGAMTNRPNWPTAAARLREFAGFADLGVHLNLTCGTPLAVMSGFAPAGELPSLGQILRATTLRRLPTAEIADEFRRQIDAFARQMGREPDFLDGHQHVHALPGVRDALFEALDTLGLTRGIYVRDPADSAAAIWARGLSAGKALGISLLARGFGAALSRRGIATNQGFSGIVPFDPRRDYGSDFAQFLKAPGRRHLVMCHPGFIDAELRAADPVNATRPLEHAFLASAAFSDLMARLDAAPARMRDIASC